MNELGFEEWKISIYVLYCYKHVQVSDRLTLIVAYGIGYKSMKFYKYKVNSKYSNN